MGLFGDSEKSQSTNCKMEDELPSEAQNTVVGVR